MPKISSILNPAFRTGTGAKGVWTLMQITTDDGKEATIFSPAAIGDEVMLTWNDQYKNYTAQKVKPNLNSPAPSSDQLDRIEKTVNQILFKVNGLKDDSVQPDHNPELPPAEVYDEQNPF